MHIGNNYLCKHFGHIRIYNAHAGTRTHKHTDDHSDSGNFSFVIPSTNSFSIINYLLHALLVLFLLFSSLGLSLPVIQMICSLAMFNAFGPQTNTIHVLYSAKFTSLVECLIRQLTYYSMVPALDRSALKCTFYMAIAL